jgi:hypothetical protein
MKRERTCKLLLNYTSHVPDPRIDANYVDHSDAMKFYFGITHHYIIRTGGQIDVGRDPLTVSSGSRLQRLQKGALFIGVVGGLDVETGHRVATITDEQNASLDWLMQAIADSLGQELEVTDYLETWGSPLVAKTEGSKKAIERLTVDLLYNAMTDEELAASPDRITV